MRRSRLKTRAGCFSERDQSLLDISTLRYCSIIPRKLDGAGHLHNAQRSHPPTHTVNSAFLIPESISS